MTDLKRQKLPTNSIPSSLTVKWPIQLLEEGYVPFPKTLVRCLHLLFMGPTAATDIAVVLVITDTFYLKRTRLPTPIFLSFLAGLSVEATMASLERLKALGYARVKASEEGLDIDLRGLWTRIEEATKD